jgi:ribonucleoside-diphosphate reductase subunit M2
MSDSPVKKLDFSSMDKENIPVTAEPTVVEPELKKPVVKPIVEAVKPPVEAPKVAPTIKPTEADEPLLQENPQRFVLFPIKYHEVRARLDASTRNVTAKLADSAADMADVQES